MTIKVYKYFDYNEENPNVLLNGSKKALIEEIEKYETRKYEDFLESLKRDIEELKLYIKREYCVNNMKKIQMKSALEREQKRLKEKKKEAKKNIKRCIEYDIEKIEEIEIKNVKL